MKFIIGSLALVSLALGQPSQAPNPTQGNVTYNADSTPIFRVTVVSRTTKAVNYNHRSGSTMVGLRGTELMPSAKGDVKVESKQGVIKIDATMDKMTAATAYGPEYLTYVMWAVTPEGRATNLGEILLGGDNSKLNATTELQSFGLIVTAEPYFAVTQPSDVVVMENFIRKDTTGTIEDLNAKYELLKRGQYTLNANPKDLQPRTLDRKTPLELYEARNAVQIARWAGAEKFANESFRKAEIGLLNAEGYLKGKGGSKKIGTVAREAVQMAEDARIITVKKLEEIALNNERSAAAAREASANQQAAESARLRAQAEQEQRLEAERRARAEAERSLAQNDANRAREERAASEAARAQSEAARAEAMRMQAAARAEADQAARAQAQTEQARLAAIRDQQAAVADAEAARASAEAARVAAKAELGKLEEARAMALKQQQSAQEEAEKARLAAADANRLRQQAETDKEHMRAQLLQQLNVVLETRDSARGLIINMSDVLFDTGLYSLKPGAREKLAKVAGIVLSHPGLKLEVEGHTDSVGGDAYNQTLSENRAESVRTFLVQQGVASGNITSKGFGKTKPVATNDNAAGRQRNRRVELVVSGELIGGTTLESKR